MIHSTKLSKTGRRRLIIYERKERYEEEHELPLASLLGETR